MYIYNYLLNKIFNFAFINLMYFIFITTKSLVKFMGRQIQILTTQLDNDIFRDYLITKYDCIFFQSFAQSKETLFINSFSETYRKDSTIYIYFKTFEWIPIYNQTSTKDKLFYIKNKSSAPIIEFSKTDLETGKHGRLYWSKYFSGNPEYDVVKFESIYNNIIKWVKKNAGGHLKISGDNYYYFKDAWTHHLNKY